MVDGLSTLALSILIAAACIAVILLSLVILSQVARFGFWLYDKRRYRPR